MMRFIGSAAFSMLVIGFIISPVWAQSRSQPVPTSGPWNTEEERLKAQLRDANDSIRNGPDGRSKLTYSEDNLRSFEMSRELTAKQEELLRPTRAELAAHAQFLKQPDVGLVRLLPRATKVVTVDKLKKENPTALMFPGGGAFYSFAKSNHSPAWADLKLQDGTLRVGFGRDVLGAATVLGDVPIDSLTFNSPGVVALAMYSVPLESNQAKIEHERFTIGVNRDGYDFQHQVPVLENTTYALRSIAYGRSDLLVAVRIVKLNDDGSVLLLWKRVGKFPKPKLKSSRR